MSQPTDEQRATIEAACARLIHLYATLNDAGEWEKLAALYTEDGVMARPTAPDAPVTGRAAILEAFRARPARRAQHLCANIVVTVLDNQHATATSAMLLFTAPDTPPLVGGFDDAFRNGPDGWRFSARRGRLTF